MDTFDYVIMTVGGALIVVGLYLYISGKKEGGSTNNLEGFGIKLNVSNPSILLIVVGVLLLLVPRFFPKTSLAISTLPAANDRSQDDSIQQVKQQSQGSQLSESKKAPRVQPQIPLHQRAFLPSGAWQLSPYSENGIDLSANIRGSMRVTTQSAQSVSCLSQFVSTDLWGNTYNYNYQGLTSSNGNAYTLQITASNDPNFFLQGPVPLELILENGECCICVTVTRAMKCYCIGGNWL
jgi:hypothetical protein